MAETRPLSDFLPLVMPYVMGAPEIVVERHIRMAIIEFCERTRCWRQIIDLPVTAQGRMVIPMPYATVHEFEFAEWSDGAGQVSPLTATQFSDVDQSIEVGTGGTPQFVTQIEPGTLMLFPPVDTGVVRVSAFLKPRSGQSYALVAGEARDVFNQAPRFIFDQFSNAIAAGAISSVLRLPQQSFTDLKMSAFYLDRFEQAMSRNFAANVSGQQRAPKRTRFSFF